jgi:hypothetical protein
MTITEYAATTARGFHGRRDCHGGGSTAELRTSRAQAEKLLDDYHVERAILGTEKSAGPLVLIRQLFG